MTLQIGIIFGGPSVEHEISILSAMQVLHVMEDGPYKPIPIYISKDLDWYCDDLLFDLENYKHLDRLCAKMKPVHLIYQNQEVQIIRKKKGFLKEAIRIDVMFPIMHGNLGEDGCLQGMLAMMDLPFVGSETLGAAIAQDKWTMKQLFAYHHIPSLPCIGVSRFMNQDDWKFKMEEIGYPCIIKPSKLGSSIGIQIANCEAELEQCMREAFMYDHYAIIEPYLKECKEYNIAVLGDESKEVSVIEEVLKLDEILSYEDKYCGSTQTKGMNHTRRIIPAELSEALSEEIKAMAVKAFEVLRLSGVCRIDFLYDTCRKQLYVNEVNTIPGSLAFYLWEESGIPFQHLIMRLIQIAVRKKRRNQTMITSYETNLLADNVNGSKIK